MADDILKQLAEEIRKAAGTGDEASRIREAKIKIQNLAYDKDNHKHLKKFTDAKHYEKLAKDLNITKETFRDKLVPTIKDSVAAFDELGEKIRDAASATLSLGKAFYKGEGTVSSYTDAFAGKFSILGDFISGTGKLLDTNIEMFRQLSQTGANFGQSIIALRIAAKESALPLDDFANLVGQNSQALAALSGSTTQGAKFIAGLGNALRTDAIPQLTTLGFTVDEINETLMLDLERQRRMGILDRGATQFNIDSAIRFGKQLDRLAKLTGVQRDELRKEIESQQSNAKFAAFLQGQTKEAADRLQGFAGVIGNIAPGLNEGFQDLIANAGRPVTDAAQQLIFNIPEAQSVIQDLINGSISTETALSKIRDASTKSIDRFRTATVTGQVEFLNLQSDIIELGRRLVNIQDVLDETEPKLADNLTKGLTQFEDASKRMGSATQSLETAFLSMIGNFVGDASSGISSGLTGLSKTLLGLPPMMAATMYGTLKIMQGGIALLKDTGPTFAAVYAGTLAGTKGLGQMWGKTKGSFGGTMGGYGKGGAGIGSKLMRGGGYLGAGLGLVGAAGSLKEDKADKGAWGTIIGTGLGFAVGGPVGAMVGGMLGGMAGGMIGGKDKRAFGTMGATGQRFEPASKLLHVDKGETVLSGNEAKTFANLNFDGVEKQLAALAAGQAAANKIHSQHLDSLNTGNIMTAKIKVATETSARKDRNQVGMV